MSSPPDDPEHTAVDPASSGRLAVDASRTTPLEEGDVPQPEGDAPAPELGVGSRIAGKYVVTEVLGRGGMGQVLAARHEELGTMVAIKAVLPEALGDRSTIARFEREARAMAKLRSEHAVRILDVGEELGMPYIMMEYLEGNDLTSEVRRRGPLPIREAVRYVLEAIDVLAEAHDLGIVHRDLKPANLFLARRPSGTRSIRLLDFGLAKPMVGAPMPTDDDPSGRAPGKVTRAGMTLGTPHFMAPEQVSSGAIGPHTDVWGVGATLYTLLTGAYAFNGPTVSLICGAVCSLPPIPPRERRAEIPKELETIILKCLEKAPNKRFLSIRELAVALGHVTNVAPPPTTMGLRMPPARPQRAPEVPPPAERRATSPSLPPARGSAPSLEAVRRSMASIAFGDTEPAATQTTSRHFRAALVLLGVIAAGAVTVALLVR